ncbi:26S proteasome regulatory subunit N10 [Enteropsectra breve]|nr:26S proteasome regulatory subunit N10 [Enteropsectra breve]
MGDISVIVYDNALSSQNQDYFPSRYLIQHEVIDVLITNILESNLENKIGLIPLAQSEQNEILTPTKTRAHLSSFLLSGDMHAETNHKIALFQAEQSLHVDSNPNKQLTVFFSSKMENMDEVMAQLYSISCRVNSIKVVCFGDAYEFGCALQEQLDNPCLQCISIAKDVDFNAKALEFLGSSFGDADPELEEAIRRSLQQR